MKWAHSLWVGVLFHITKYFFHYKRYLVLLANKNYAVYFNQILASESMYLKLSVFGKILIIFKSK